MKLVLELVSPWIWTMAWRDSRREWRRLILYSLAIVFGIAALVSIGSLRENLSAAVEKQAKELLGADLMLAARRPWSEDMEQAIRHIPGERIQETSFMTMLQFPDHEGGTRLTQIRAIEAGFPFYGTVQTEPEAAWQAQVAGQGVVLERALMEQFGVKVGDRVRIGELETKVLGSLVEAPPRLSAFSALAAQGFLSPRLLDETELMGSRSLARYRIHFQIEEGTVDVDKEILDAKLKEYFVDEGITPLTVKMRKRMLGRALDNLYSFISLIGFIALILGGIGVASAIHVHVSGRIGTVATLRCIG
ncbi:MAG: ABC transporter permease, partial [Verrucomicrobiota bacterium]